MNLKKHFLAAGLAVTALTGLGQAAAHTKVQDAAELPAAALTVEKQSRWFETFYWPHCEKISHNIKGCNWSFGDEKMMQDAFWKIAKDPKHYKMIAALPSNFKIKSALFTGRSSTRIQGVHSTGKVYIKSSTISSQAFDLKIRKKLYGTKGDGVSIDLYNFLKHEIIHEWDDTQGRMLKKGKVGKYQRYRSSLKAEAHAYAWNLTDTLTYIFIDGYNDIGSRCNFEKFINQDVEVSILDAEKKRGSRFKEEYKKFIKTFHEKLKSGNTLEEVQKEMVGLFMEDFMEPLGEIMTWEFKESYYNCAAKHTLDLFYRGNITKNENLGAEKKVNDFFIKEYKVDPVKLNSLGFTYEIIDILNKAEDVLKNFPDVKSTEYRKNIYNLMLDAVKLNKKSYTIQGISLNMPGGRIHKINPMHPTKSR